MATNYNQPLNLNVTASNLFTKAVSDSFEIVHGDLTQLGLERNKLPSALHLPASKSIILDFPAASHHPLFKGFVRLPNDVPKDSLLRFDVNTSALLSQRIGASDENQAQAISDLQKALRPDVLVKHDDIIKSQRIREAIEDLRSKRENAKSVITAYINPLIDQVPRLRSFLVDNGLLASDQGTIKEAENINSDDLDSLNHGQLLQMRGFVSDAPLEVDKAFEILTFLLFWEDHKNSVSIGEHPMIRDAYYTARGELAAVSFTPPDVIRNIYARKTSALLITASVSYQIGEEFKALTLKENVSDRLGELLFYFISLKQILSQNMDRAREFAFTRLLVVRHGLFYDSDEVSEINLDAPLVVDASELSEFVQIAKRPERIYACLYTAAISFLKSGHHASTANLDNTLLRILGSLGINVQIDVARNMLPYAVYCGTHVASVRMLIGYLFYKNATEKITNSISYRMVPNPPGSAAYCNLELFIDSLEASKFFDVLDRTREYTLFKTQMQEIRRTMYFVAPYANYLYGHSVKDPLHIKNEAAKLASYATAIRSVLPNTTLADSPSLMRIATQQGRNDISANLLVIAYVTGFQRYFKHTIEASMARKYGVNRNLITI